MDDLQNQNLVDDQIMEAISGDETEAPTPAPEPVPAPLVDGPEETTLSPVPAPEPVLAPESIETPSIIPAPEPAPTMATIESPEPTPVPAPSGVPSVHDLGLLDKDEKSEETKVTVTDDTPVAMPSTISLSGDTPLTGDDAALAGVKQQALQQLSPLLNKLDLAPEQRFETYMEVIRASDDKNLVKPAFEAAQAIPDEDKKAQALLDVVNEVNYLTQDHNDTPKV